MPSDAYARFELIRPLHLGDAHWQAINVEIERFSRALDADDDQQAIGYLKCLVEAVAKVVQDINGTPADGNTTFDTVTKSAHELLAMQPGYELVYETPFGNLATQARKIAVSMSTIRNGYGAGHGRSRLPPMRDEMLDLAIDGSLMWTRWALRRLEYFVQGRPEPLIRDLIGDPFGQISWPTGNLTRRLDAANLPNLESKHARAIGVAVGQRAAQDTFNVRIEGIEPCVNDPDLSRWPAPYRLGIATGLLQNPVGFATVTCFNLRLALEACLPVVDASDDIVALIQHVLETNPPGRVPGQPIESTDLIWFIEQSAPKRPASERPAWIHLAEHLKG